MQNTRPKDFQLALTGDLHRWRTFLTIAELGSLTRAALFLDSNQSLLSRQLNALERECGARLFSRTGRGVELSDVGRKILPQVRALLEDAEALERDILGEAREPAGRVIVGSLPSISVSFIGRLFTAMRERHPAVTLRVFEGSSRQLEEWLADARIDIAILYRYGASPPEQEQAMAMVDSYLIGCRDDELTASSEVPFAALHELPLILPSAPNGLRAALDAMARQERITLSPAMEADSLQLFKLLVEHEKLYTVLPLHAVWNERAQGRLQAAKIVSPPLQRIISMALNKTKGPSRAVLSVTAQISAIVNDMAKRGMWHSGPPGGGISANQV
ncbi:LysR substrate-binding domain-containing protein [Variovorax terrae]|uniref:LysR substrate-binding domain-containing protein n=1 Tax=Variovorax terrae TaxID=2923278 RepID=A0A9X1VQQ4_9BURK|nr:LysR substrate-binding domain-containing protein [Variovorax terrae]MCJ0761608.1 LysR substrate-binding domain-containing protein [Variovorax terrae]